eukprot:gene19022-6958_t
MAVDCARGEKKFLGCAEMPPKDPTLFVGETMASVSVMQSLGEHRVTLAVCVQWKLLRDEPDEMGATTMTGGEKQRKDEVSTAVGRSALNGALSGLAGSVVKGAGIALAGGIVPLATAVVLDTAKSAALGAYRGYQGTAAHKKAV